jgi:hypothetical protein
MHDPAFAPAIHSRPPALGPAATFLIALAVIPALALSGCAASMAVALRSDRSASLTVRVELPDEVAAKVAQLRGDPAGSVLPLVDPAMVRAGAEENGVRVLEAKALGERGFRGSFEVADLAALGSKARGALALAATASGGSLAISIDRANAAELFALFPGLDPYLVEALSPPALDGSDLTKDEYREMLGALLGTKSLPALDAAKVDLAVELPGAPLAAGTVGFALSGRTAKASIKLLDLLVLERPVALKVSWGR